MEWRDIKIYQSIMLNLSGTHGTIVYFLLSSSLITRLLHFIIVKQISQLKQANSQLILSYKATYLAKPIWAGDPICFNIKKRKQIEVNL